MLALVSVLLAALYLNGVVYYVVLDVDTWRKQGIPFSWRMIGWRKFTWPLAMLSDTLRTLGR